MTASGPAGHGAELAAFGDLSVLGAHVVKSLAAFEWAGNPAPRVAPTTAGMINAVGLQGPGVSAWLRDDLPGLEATGAAIVVSIWGRGVEDYRRAAELLAAAPPSVVAVEVNLSCPNLEGRRGIFAHDPELSAQVMRATSGCGRPRWAKLSPNTDRIVEVAGAVADAGAESVTLVNTLLGMVIDTDTGRPALGAGGGERAGSGSIRSRSGRPRRPCGPPGSGDRRGRGRRHRTRRGRTAAGGSERRAGRHGHVRRSACALDHPGRTDRLEATARHRPPRRRVRRRPSRRIVSLQEDR
ncbi:MAG: hypothetical protein R2705_03500 [Ilumatobacteraceae bacterium]